MIKTNGLYNGCFRSLCGFFVSVAHSSLFKSKSQQTADLSAEKTEKTASAAKNSQVWPDAKTIKQDNS